ncbi:GGDEF domain-containing protein [Deinococcus peraridilitoris]|uniref:Diguanylate cyclase (GGDEF) domain-containing protein n=1 Tax=Deinococcus peraridilitoris (strain DSM 19664 / LMG 22246 / CIP 109416 / KR-200) TaxID=937777 RepID=L0A4L7_DEIPD|nr:GGDEF domain-containing protein [Deinococcus peraridilitoris]AFZ68379.1 diguanylate cyclase (GGDEF) domain-containing protein [Deinococcus peraridilitoris DSM 19664]
MTITSPDVSTNRAALPDPWVSSRRSLLLGQFSVGVIACLLALAVQWPNPDALDGIALPVLALVLASLFTGLWTRRLSDQAAGRLAFISLAVYFLLSLNYQLLAYVPERLHLSESTYWFTVVYCTAFIVWRRRAAMAWATVTFALAGFSTVTHLPDILRTSGFDPDLLGFVAQFFAAGLAAILLLYHITLLQERYSEARMLAYADFLTGLPNRRCGEILLENELRNSGPLTVVLFDLDHFKSVNDTYGHDIGDLVLREAARLTALRVRGEHLVVRWGGEEFLLIMPRTDARVAEHLAERIRADIAHHRFEGAGPLTASFGMAVQRAGDTSERLVKRADAALYRAKQLGRNRVKLPTMF